MTVKMVETNAVWRDCWQCGGEGDLDGECTCGEDTCCCLDPEPPRCDICRGKGGFYVPLSAATDEDVGLAPAVLLSGEGG